MPNYVCSKLVMPNIFYRYMNNIHIYGLFMLSIKKKTCSCSDFTSKDRGNLHFEIKLPKFITSSVLFPSCLIKLLAFPRCRQASNLVFLLQFLSHRDKECVDLLRECCICRMHHFPTTKIGNKS